MFKAFFDNSVLENKELVVTSHKWLIPIKEQYPALEKEYKRLELEKPLDDKAYSGVKEMLWTYHQKVGTA